MTLCALSLAAFVAWLEAAPAQAASGDQSFMPLNASPANENIVDASTSWSQTFSVGLSGVLVWVFAQKENFNPAERDLPYRMLAERPVEDRLYRRPFVHWRPQGAGVAGSADRDELP